VNTISFWPDGNGGTQNYPDDSTKTVVSYYDMPTKPTEINLHP